jgi:hypothetical protein
VAHTVNFLQELESRALLCLYPDTELGLFQDGLDLRSSFKCRRDAAQHKMKIQIFAEVEIGHYYLQD